MSISKEQFFQAVAYLERHTLHPIVPDTAPDGRIWTMFNAFASDGRILHVTYTQEVDSPDRSPPTINAQDESVPIGSRGSVSPMIAGIREFDDHVTVQAPDDLRFGFANAEDVEALLINMADLQNTYDQRKSTYGSFVTNVLTYLKL